MRNSQALAVGLLTLAMAGAAQAATVHRWSFDQVPGFSGPEVPVANSSTYHEQGTYDAIGGGAALVAKSSQIVWSDNTPGNNTDNASNQRSLWFGSSEAGQFLAGNELSPSAQFTVEAYIRRDTGITSGFGTIAAQGTYGNPPGLVWNLGLNYGSALPRMDGSLTFTVNTGTDWGTWQQYVVDDPTLLITDTNWHHVAVTRDASNRVHLYVDGVEDLSLGGSGAAPFAGQLGTGNSFSVGLAPGADSFWQFRGGIDEVRLSDTDLSPTGFLNAVPEPGALGICGLAVLFLRRRV